jgi:L-ascorbate metabolism protein UlaG (beta-lactamase superfamily)
MYNLPESPTAMHTKGRGNGYVLGIGGRRIYLSGDTQGIPEMRALKDIDVAFVCMNLPYTMAVDEAADAVLAFKPHIVYPYHYRGQGGLSDVNAFKAKVEAGDKNIEVRLRNWYPSK